MTVRELIETLDILTEENRVICVKNLYKLLSGVSKQTLTQFQIGYDSNKPFEEFVAEQNKVIQQCISLELSPIGAIVRKKLNLVPLTEGTVL